LIDAEDSTSWTGWPILFVGRLWQLCGCFI
jgi:hypothetical protein